MDDRTETRGILGQPLPLALRDELSEWVRRDGETYVIATIGIGRPTLARAIAGLGLRAGSLVLIRQGLDAVRGRR